MSNQLLGGAMVTYTAFAMRADLLTHFPFKVRALILYIASHLPRSRR